MARPKKIDTLSISELQAIISEKKNKRSSLRRERAKLLKKLAAVEREIERSGGEVSGRRSGSARPRNEKSLAAVIEEVLKGGKQLRVAEIADAVQATGYKSNSSKFVSIVNQALIKDKKKFHSVERGVYALRK